MMRAIIEASLQFRYLLVTLAAAMMVVGVFRLSEMPVDVLPEYAPPYVEVQTESLGLSADEVESLVTVNLEELLQGVPWLQTMRSQSVPGLSSIVLIFQPGTDIYRARQVVQERLTLAHMLPNVSSPPMVLQPLSATSRVMVVGLSSKTVAPIQMSVLARWKIRPALMSLPGVANVSIWGQRERQLQVQVDPEKLRAGGVSLEQIIRTTGDALWVSPLTFLLSSAPGTGGWIDTPQQRLEVRHVLPIASPQDLAQVPIVGSHLRLGDVANVVENHQPLIGDAVREADSSLLLVVEKFPGANTLELTRRLESTLNTMRPGLSGIEIDSTILRPASFIEMATANLITTLVVAAALLVLILLVLLLRLRIVVICLVAIPLSLTAAALVLHLRGATLNAMTLAGLLIALGVIVDDAVVGPENIARRLRQRRAEVAGRSPASAAMDVVAASIEMRRPLMFATLIALLAIVPVFLIRGVSGALMQPMAMSYVLAILASLVVALTVTPALSLILVSDSAAAGREPPFVTWLRRGYHALLARTFGARVPAYLGAVVLVMSGPASLSFVGLPSLIPTLQERQLVVQLEGMPGASHPEMTRITAAASGELRMIPGVTNVGAHVGRALLGDEVVGMNVAKIWVSIGPSADYRSTLAAIQQVVDRYPTQGGVQGYVERTVREALAGSTGDMVVRVYGPEWTLLRSTAESVTAALSKIDGIVDLQPETQIEEPHVEVEVDLLKAQRSGIKPGDVRRAAATLVNGLNVGLLFEDQKIFDVVVWSTPETRDSLSDIRDMLIDTPGGGRVRLQDIADIRVAPTLNTIKREAVSRRIDVSFNVRDRDVDSVARDVERALHGVSFPLEYHAELLGEYAERQGAQRGIVIAGLIAALGVFLLLQAAFQSWRLATMTFLTLPLALLGGLLAAALGGGSALSLGSILGLLTVLAIATRNAVVLISHFQHLEREEGEPLGPGLVLRGASERLAPVVTTGLATAVAVAPIVAFGNIPGHEIWHPIAVAILGGLVSATLFALFVIPSLYLRIAPLKRGT